MRTCAQCSDYGRGGACTGLVDPDPEAKLGIRGYENTYSKCFLADLRGCLEGIEAATAAARERLGLPAAARGDALLERAAGVQGVSAAQLQTFVEFCVQRYNDKRIDPGVLPAYPNSPIFNLSAPTAVAPGKILQPV